MKMKNSVLKGFLTREEYLKASNENFDCYFTVNGQLIRSCEDLDNFDDPICIKIHPRLRGGKGGFGSMLRAIGNQIEKTNNNDMCRDLSGRRIRDVNAEAKLKEWYANASERERAKLDRFLEKQKRRREALAKGPLHDHKFNDPEFSRRKEHISAELQEAVEDLLRKIVADSGPAEPPKKRRKLWIETIDGYDLSSSDGADSDSDISSPDLDPEPSTSKSTQDNRPVGTIRIADVSKPKSDKIEKSNPTCSKNGSVDVQEPTSPKVDEHQTPNFVSITDKILNGVSSPSELESYGLESLKQALSSKGLKCGGTLSERASRLFSVRDLDPADYPVKLLAAKPKK
ncbi:unnamed protein product [Hymenolepis diminuta]|uniref:Uncharacterized protein n=1 Tax=Hymenolepis diminuta TaxID=6216 RepID=A0A564YBZ0_HYMDI|nr:unnamed protein product [Hymenolepis diminuta]